MRLGQRLQVWAEEMVSSDEMILYTFNLFGKKLPIVVHVTCNHNFFGSFFSCTFQSFQNKIIIK